MNKTPKFLLFSATFLFLINLHTVGVKAKDEFETSYEVKYTVESSGKTRVSQEIALTNRFSNLYATQYSLIMKGLKIENISAHDEIGPLQSEVKQTENGEEITLHFNQQAVGLGKTLNFNLSYTALDLTDKNGQIWEINIPRISETDFPSAYSVTLCVPQSLGQLAFIRPTPIGQTAESGYNNFQFSKEQLLNTGINAVLGEFQIFNFNLTYPLDNRGYSAEEMEISLPPDTAYQQLSYTNISPPPINVRVDPDGNWLALYHLKAGEKFSVTASGQVKIFPDPRKTFSSPPDEILRQNLLPQKYWETDNPLILAKAEELETVKNIYNFVVNHLNYDLSRVKTGVDRLGALKAIESPDQAICMEFADLFIALCRAAGIPAREINGFAYTTNEKLQPLGMVADVLHSWPEYYDPNMKQWIPVDPTWEKTSGGIDHFSKPDLNHFAFVIHGTSSESPASAGFHENTDFQKNVEVTFGDYQPPATTNLKVEFQIPKEIFWGITRKGKVIIKNSGPEAADNLGVSLESDSLAIAFSKDSTLPSKITTFPPYSQKSYIFDIKSQEFFKSSWTKITLKAGDQEFYQWLKIGFPYAKIILVFLAALIIISLVIFLTKIILYVKNRP